MNWIEKYFHSREKRIAISGAYISCRATGCEKKVTDHLGITLLPQAGVALGMATTAANLSDGAVVCNVVLFSVLVYELVGPTLTKRSLIAAGEIETENPASERVLNKTGNLRGLKSQVQRRLPWGNQWVRRRA
ncbi:MAG: hypothetical protein LUE65_06685 [Clostridiales bacterium]|nr:hypothetical protein [Clostridiales bacterium]